MSCLHNTNFNFLYDYRHQLLNFSPFYNFLLLLRKYAVSIIYYLSPSRQVVNIIVLIVLWQPPPIVKVVLQVYMHCEACAQLLRKRIRKMKGALFQINTISLLCSEIQVLYIYTPRVRRMRG